MLVFVGTSSQTSPASHMTPLAPPATAPSGLAVVQLRNIACNGRVLLATGTVLRPKPNPETVSLIGWNIVRNEPSLTPFPPPEKNKWEGNLLFGEEGGTCWNSTWLVNLLLTGKGYDCSNNDGGGGVIVQDCGWWGYSNNNGVIVVGVGTTAKKGG